MHRNDGNEGQQGKQEEKQQEQAIQDENKKEKQEESKSNTPSSFAAIRARFNSRNQPKQSSSNNSQRNAVQLDLENIRTRKLANPGETSSSTSRTSDVPNDETSSTNQQRNTVQQELENLRNRKLAKPAEMSSSMASTSDVPNDGTSSVNQQRNTVQQDLENLRNRNQGLKFAPSSNTSDVSQLSSTSKKAADELANLNLGFSEKTNKLKSFFSGTSTSDIHSEVTAKELEKLGATGSVRAKAETLDTFYKTQAGQALTEVKVNKTSKLAEGRLNQLEFKLFTERQNTLITKVEQQINEDAQAYAKKSLKDEMTFARFLELDFYYRAYQVCLEQDFRRHAALSIKQKANFNNEELKMLVGIPNQLAVESLNYYKDFFLHLPDIEKIWPGAGVGIRKAEVRVIYAATVFTNPNALYTILNDAENEKEKRSYVRSCEIFEEAFKEFITSSRNRCNIAGYIASGNGLDSIGHPWTAYGYKRLEQPNDTIDFSKIVPVDQVHAQAMNQVSTRVENDSTRMKMS